VSRRGLADQGNSLPSPPLIRAQVGEPENSRGYVARRGPLSFYTEHRFPRNCRIGRLPGRLDSSPRSARIASRPQDRVHRSSALYTASRLSTVHSTGAASPLKFHRTILLQIRTAACHVLDSIEVVQGEACQPVNGDASRSRKSKGVHTQDGAPREFYAVRRGEW